jgi:hypothetical protein
MILNRNGMDFADAWVDDLQSMTIEINPDRQAADNNAVQRGAGGKLSLRRATGGGRDRICRQIRIRRRQRENSTAIIGRAYLTPAFTLSRLHTSAPILVVTVLPSGPEECHMAGCQINRRDCGAHRD